MMKYKLFLLLIFLTLTGCVGTSSTGVLGTGVSITTIQEQSERRV